MDKKGYVIGLIKKAKVVISNLERIAYMMQDRSQEGVFLLECIAIDGGILTPQIIFKGKKKCRMGSSDRRLCYKYHSF